jgi:hypothetical protein
MKKSLPLWLALLAALFAGQALAQQVQVPSDRMKLKNLRSYMLADDGKSVSPHAGPVRDDYSAPFWIEEPERMLGNPYTMGCVELWSTGEGRMTYNLKGGRLEQSGSCTNIGTTDYQWTTTVSFSPGKLILNGEARTVGPCLPGKIDCERPTLVATEKAVIRIAGRKCFVESYHFKTSETTGNPYLKGHVDQHVTFSTPKSRCEFDE